MQKSRKNEAFWLLAVPSAVLFIFGLYLTLSIKYPSHVHQEWGRHIRAFALVYAMWLVIMFAHNLFDFQVLRRYTTLVFSLISSMLVSLVAAIIYFYYQPEFLLTPRRFLLLHVLLVTFLLAAWYLFVKTMMVRRNPENIYLFAFGDERHVLEEEIKNHNYLGFRLKGYIGENDLSQLQFADGASIVFPETLRSRPELLSKFYDLRKNRIAFYSYHDFYEELTRKIDLTSVNEFWFLANINYQNKRRVYHLVKRGFDFVFGLLMMLAFIVTWPLISLAIKLNSKGPVLFIQERVGQNGQIFRMYKYRTMRAGEGNTWTQEKDSRITGVGKLLRRFRLDELPQFINLLRGNMSLVGPRPEQVGIVEALKKQIPFFDERHLVKPGLTGWAQLNIYASSLEETRQKLQYDLYYIKNQSLFFDLEIILKTLYYIVAGSWR